MGRTGTPLPTPQQPAPAAVCSTSSWRALTSRERRARRRAAARAWARADPTGRGAVPASVGRARVRSHSCPPQVLTPLDIPPLERARERTKEGASCVSYPMWESTDKSRKQENNVTRVMLYMRHGTMVWWEVGRLYTTRSYQGNNYVNILTCCVIIISILQTCY